MKNIFIILIANAVPLLLAGISGYMAINHIHGWGWFLAASLAVTTSIRIKD